MVNQPKRAVMLVNQKSLRVANDRTGNSSRKCTSVSQGQSEVNEVIHIVSDSESEQGDDVSSVEECPTKSRTRYLRSLGSLTSSSLSSSSSSEVKLAPSHSTSRIMTRSRRKVSQLLDNDKQNETKETWYRKPDETGSPQRSQRLLSMTASPLSSSSPEEPGHLTSRIVTRSRYRVSHLLDTSGQDRIQEKERKDWKPATTESPHHGQSLWSLTASPLSSSSSPEMKSAPGHLTAQRSRYRVPQLLDGGMQDELPEKDRTNGKVAKVGSPGSVSPVFGRRPRNRRLDYHRVESEAVSLPGRYQTRAVKLAIAAGDLTKQVSQSIPPGNVQEGFRRSPRLVKRSPSSMQIDTPLCALGQEISVKQCRRKLKMEEEGHRPSAEGISPSKRPRFKEEEREIDVEGSQTTRRSQRLSGRE